MIDFQKRPDSIACFDWDAFNGDHNAFIGSIKLNEDDGYYWFHPANDRIPLTCKQLKQLADRINSLNLLGLRKQLGTDLAPDRKKPVNTAEE